MSLYRRSRSLYRGSEKVKSGWTDGAPYLGKLDPKTIGESQSIQLQLQQILIAS